MHHLFMRSSPSIVLTDSSAVYQGSEIELEIFEQLVSLVYEIIFSHVVYF